MPVLEKDRRDGMKCGLADIVRMAALCCLLLVFAPHAFAADAGPGDGMRQATHSYGAEDAASVLSVARPCDRAATSDLLDCGCTQLCLVFGVLPAAMGIDDAGKAGVLSARPYRIVRAGLSPAKHPPRRPALV
ncbi:MULTISPECIES: hypothetical protein [Oceanibaculum]|uniref:Uncharacterized protein n=1 Tax=Oceanibaculum indicum P24 TaxID=1207063 RepID=K2KGY3_9PROT|nr:MULTISPECIES: hypothetical protein [Oceanibaculum]EKE76560.1 hypothetical protein P24_07944 [Oceanibaculum indicum P24]MCH2396292.1 hypothetical protein [Oceanibaculum sp.]